MLRTGVLKVALWSVVLLVVAASVLPMVSASSSTYTLYGYAYQGTGAPVPGGVTVDLVSSATGQVYTTTTSPGGGFLFASGTNAPNLAPGTWGVRIPVQTNLTGLQTSTGTIPYPVAVLPASSSPAYLYQSSTNLTSGGLTGFVTVRNVNVLQYDAAINGTVTYAPTGGTPAVQRGATVELLDPARNDMPLVTNVTNAAGFYSLEAPQGAWILETILPAPNTRYNLTEVSISEFQKMTVNVVVGNYIVSGTLSVGSSGAAPNTAGNVTVYDPTDGHIYTGSFAPSGYYSFGTASNLTGQTIDVFLEATNTTTAYYTTTVTSSATVKNVRTSPAAPSNRASYVTTLNFTSFNRGIGNGTLSVYTNATLGNNTILSYLPNETVGQLWAQLGLDFSHSSTFSSADWPAVVQYLNSSGAFFPAIQAGTTINGTGFTTNYLSNGAPAYSFAASSACSSTDCGPTSTNSISLSYAQTFSLSSTVTANSPAYTLQFNVLNPNSHGSYVYNAVLPTGYVLKAGTVAPKGVAFQGAGPEGTWTTVGITTYPSSSTYTTITLPIVKEGGSTPIVNVTGSNFGFSSANVLNSTHGNYTVVVAQGVNDTFSALNTIYASGVNGTYYSWDFGDGNYYNSTSSTTTYAYLTNSSVTNAPYDASLTIRSSSGALNTTAFHVWVGPKNGVAAVLSYNVTGSRFVKQAGGVTYLQVNYGYPITFNATASRANSTDRSIPGVLSVALFSLAANKYARTQNNSVSTGATFDTPFSVSFLGNGFYFNGTTIGGQHVSFLGWRYYVNLTVWSGTGGYGTTSLIVLVNDTQKPISAFSLLNSAGAYIPPGGSVTEASNFTAKVVLNGANASDPNNGSIVNYVWNITNSGNSSYHHANITQIAAGPSYKYPGRVAVWLPPQTVAYTINLTVMDRAGNTNYSKQSITVAVNSTVRPIMSAANFTGPTSLVQGTSYTYWINVTTGGGSKAVGYNITVSWYLLSPSGTGARKVVVPSSDVLFYNYSSPGVVNTTVAYKGLYPALALNKTVRAEITWTPGLTGNYNLYANVSASNEYAANYNSGPQTVVLAIAISPSPLSQALIYIVIAAVVIVLIVFAVYWYRRRGRQRTRPASRSGLERGSRRKDDSDDSS